MTCVPDVGMGGATGGGQIISIILYIQKNNVIFVKTL